MSYPDKILIITPVPASAEKVAALIVRLDAIFINDKKRYEIQFIASRTAPEAVAEINEYMANFPVKVVDESEAIDASSAGYVALFGNTAKYPPEALLKMVQRLEAKNGNIVVGVRNSVPRLALNLTKSSLVAHPSKYSARAIEQTQLVVAKPDALYLHDGATIKIGIPGLLKRVQKADAQVIYYNLAKTKSVFTIRQEHMFKSYYNTLFSSLKDFFASNNYSEFDTERTKERGKGFYYKGKEYVTHNSLTRRNSAIERTTLLQRAVLASLLIVLLILALLSGKVLLVAIVSLITVLYFCDLLFNFFLIYRSFKSYSEISIDDADVKVKRDWSVYTIFCPLYKETLVIPQFIAAMEAIDYPRDKFEVLLLLEQDDTESIEAIEKMNLPNHFKLTVVPHSLPKTKPKACNYGLQRATGDYAVIYDAEDLPDPLQLKKAVLAFERSGENIGCIQAKLNYYNWDQNLLTRLFTLEYSLWFNLILTGLQSIKAPIPLGGTSNHFRTANLREFGGWDPFNVTEDADLGMRLAKRGMKTAILDSTTLEEANSEVRNWLKQRSRWIKGYMQTYLVHMRNVREFGRNSSRIDMVTFQLIIGGKILSMLINPILWIMTLSYFILRPYVGPTIESLYLAPIFYIGAVSLVIGNFMYLYYYMMGAARQGKPELIPFALLVPVYWLMMSIAAFYALRDLLVRPFHWHKTKHGLHLKKQKAKTA